jgi:hypothetical protein
MQILNKSARFGLVLAVLFLAACQTTSTTPISANQVPSLISGIWKGHFINTQGTAFPVTFDITGNDGKISGQADIPDSSYDAKPTLHGSYAGNEIVIRTSSNFTNTLTLSVAENGDYWLKGKTTGPNTGRLELKRQ